MRLFVWLSLALMLAAPPARAHDFYDPYCCRGEMDCQPIKESAVKITDWGYAVTLYPTDHSMLANEKNPITYLVSFKHAKRSPDGGYHACIYPTPKEMRCFYAPDMGS